MSNISLVKIGCRDQIVVEIQHALNQRMLPPYNKITKPAKKRLVLDGKFGPKTDDMVREFQRLNRLKPDGIVGPITRLHLFPWVEIDGTLRGKGEFGIPVGSRRGAVARRGLTGDLVADGDKKDGDDEEDQQGFQFSPFVAAGTEFTLTKPWPPGSGSAQQTMTFGGVLLRGAKLELSGELERSKALQPKRGDKWEWEGSVKLAYKGVPKIGRISPLSPFVQVATSKLPVIVGIGAEVDIFGKDVLKFTVDGEGAFTYDTKDDDGGKLRAALRVNFGLEFNLDILFRKHEPSKP